MSLRPSKATSEEKLDWEVEKLRKEVRNLGRTFIFAIVTAFLAVATTTYQIYDKISSLRIQEYERARIEADIKELQRQKQDLAKEHDIVTSNLNQYKSEFSDLISDPKLTPQQKLEQLQQISPSFQFTVPDSTQSDLPPRIYLQYLGSQSGNIENYVRQLEAANYKVTQLPRSSSTRRKGATVAYYYDGDQEQAQKLIDFLKAMKIPNVEDKPTKVTGPARPKHFDLWIALPE